jgi:hypothetical protein
MDYRLPLFILRDLEISFSCRIAARLFVVLPGTVGGSVGIIISDLYGIKEEGTIGPSKAKVMKPEKVQSTGMSTPTS